MLCFKPFQACGAIGRPDSDSSHETTESRRKVIEIEAIWTHFGPMIRLAQFSYQPDFLALRRRAAQHCFLAVHAERTRLYAVTGSTHVEHGSKIIEIGTIWTHFVAISRSGAGHARTAQKHRILAGWRNGARRSGHGSGGGPRARRGVALGRLR